MNIAGKNANSLMGSEFNIKLQVQAPEASERSHQYLICV